MQDTRQQPAQEPAGRTIAPRCRARRAARCARARTPTSRPGLQGYAVMAGIVVAEGRGSAVTDVDGNSVPGLHRRHRRQRARALAPDATCAAVQEQVARASVGSFTSKRARRARRAAGRGAAGAGRAPPAALLGRRGGGRERAAAGQVPHRQVRVRQLLGRLPRQDDGRAVADGLDLQGQARARWCRARTRCPTPTATAARCGSSTRAAASPAPRSAASRSRPRRAGAVAAIIVEPMQGTAGNVIPPKEFLPAMRSLADERRARC